LARRIQGALFFAPPAPFLSHAHTELPAGARKICSLREKKNTNSLHFLANSLNQTPPPKELLLSEPRTSFLAKIYTLLALSLPELKPRERERKERKEDISISSLFCLSKYSLGPSLLWNKRFHVICSLKGEKLIKNAAETPSQV